MSYYFTKILENTDFETAFNRTSDALKEEGFGIISEIDYQATLKDKLNVDIEEYLVLQACNPSYAYKSLRIENKIGLMLPCNVVVQEIAESTFEVSSINPKVAMLAIDNNEMIKIAGEVSDKLERVIENL